MGFFSGIKKIGSAGMRAATGGAGKLVPGVPRAVSGVVGKALPSAMRAAPQPMGLVDRIQAARGGSAASAKAAMNAGKVVGINPSFRFARPRAVRKFW